jgi:hypothetical protein
MVAHDSIKPMAINNSVSSNEALVKNGEITPAVNHAAAIIFA